MRPVGGTQNEILAIEEIYQTRVTLGEFDDERHDALQNLGQAQVTNHETADPLEQSQLLFGPLEPELQLFGLRHSHIIVCDRADHRSFAMRDIVTVAAIS